MERDARFFARSLPNQKILGRGNSTEVEQPPETPARTFLALVAAGVQAVASVKQAWHAEPTTVVIKEWWTRRRKKGG